MVIFVLEKVPSGVRGELSRWFLEPKAGVFVGKASALVRDLLWEKICNQCKDGGSLLLYNTNNEQGFTIRSHGDTSRTIKDFEGLLLVQVPQP